MKVLGIETSCDETGVAVYDTERGLLSEVLHSQVELHARYGGVVPELASRDHIRRLSPLVRQALRDAGTRCGELDAIAYTAGPGLAGALLVGAGFAESLALARNIPALPIHHLEGHLLSPLIGLDRPQFPFVALLVSGGHTQLMQVCGVGRYELLGESLDDAAGEAFDKTAKLLGLGYPGGPALAALAVAGRPGRFRLPRPMIASGDLDQQAKADLAAEFQQATIDVLIAKALAATRRCGGRQLVVAGGVGANLALRAQLSAAAASEGIRVIYPPPRLCTDNGAMIAFAGAARLAAGGAAPGGGAFSVRPRWPLQDLSPAS